MTAHQEFKNDNITVTMTQNPGCRIHLQVAVSPLATQAAYQKAIKAVSKEVSIPGFRKGKAPEKVIVKNYSQYIEREWKDIILNTAFEEAIKLSKIYPFNKQSVSKATLKASSLEEGSTLIYEYESSPATPSISIANLSIHKPVAKSVTESDIAETIENLRLQHAEWNDILDRPAAEGDFVDLDINAIDNDERNICTNQRFEIAAGKMGKWMRELIVGMKPGDSAEKMSEQEDNDKDCEACQSGEHHHEHNHFQPTLCRITLNTIKSATLPEVNDEFAKKFGVETVEELKTRIDQTLNRQAQESHVNLLRKLMESELLAKYSFDIPFSLVNSQMKEQAANIVAELKEQGLTGATLQTEADKIEKNVANRLMRDFTLYFLTQKIAQEHNIEITENELTEEMIHQLRSKVEKNQLDPNYDVQEMRSQAYVNTLIKKTLDYLVNRISEKSQDTAN